MFTYMCQSNLLQLFLNHITVFSQNICSATSHKNICKTTRMQILQTISGATFLHQFKPK